MTTPKPQRPRSKRYAAACPDVIETAAMALAGGVRWDDTFEGHTYWSTVHTKLVAMAKEIRTIQAGGPVEITRRRRTPK